MNRKQQNRVMTMQKNQMVNVPILGWVTTKQAEQFKALDILDKESVERKNSGARLYRCTLDGKQVQIDSRFTKAIYILYRNGRPHYVGKTEPNRGRSLHDRPLDHLKPGRYQKEFDAYNVIALPKDVDILMAEMCVIEKLKTKYNLKNNPWVPPMKYREYRLLHKLWQSYNKRRCAPTEPFGHSNYNY